MASKLTLAAILTFVLSGCAYGYAGQEGKRRSQREYKQSTKVVTVREEDPDDTKKPDPEPEPEPVAESPCGTPTFDIHFFQASGQVTKTIDCEQRRVVNTDESAMGSSSYESARAAGLPEGTWYFLVDPTGETSGILNNAQLLKLSREFSIEYYGKESSRNLLVYLYQQDDVR